MVISDNFISLPVDQQFHLPCVLKSLHYMIVLLFITLSAYPRTFAAPAVLNNLGHVLSHEQWDTLLKKYVSENGEVNYRGLKSEQSKLNAYLEMLSSNPPAEESRREDEMVYWINAYNAFTVRLILNNYPLKSIRDVKNGKPWDDPFITLGGKKYSLNNIEHDVLRKKFGDPRIHFAINCASRSCPKLVNRAFTADQLETQLDNAARSFINDSSKNKITASDATISEIFKWYKDDFTKHGTLIDYLNTFSSVKISSNASIRYLNYDWSLNEQP
jgi:hypothetical protein